MANPEQGVECGPAECRQLREELALARTEARELGESLQTVLGLSTDAVYRRNVRTDTCDFISPAIERITGFTPAEYRRMSSEVLLRYIHPDDHPVIERRLKEMALSLEGVAIPDFFEYRMLCKDGSYRWLSDSGRIVVGPDGAPLYHLGVARDITLRKRLEEELRQHNETLEKAVADRTARLRRLAWELAAAEQRERKRLSEFLHDDLQQVLVAAKYGAERLVLAQPDGGLHTEAQKLADHVAEAVERVRTFCNSLATPLLYVVGLVPALRELAGQMLGRYGLRVTVELKDMEDLKESALGEHLYHAVRELLFNVAKHAGTDMARVSGVKSAERVELTVADTGRGFDPARVLDGDMPSCGYGLFSVRERIHSLGGDLRIESSPGRGTSVTIIAPVTRSLEPNLRPAPSAEQGTMREERTPAAATGARPRVLVADDHELVRSGVAKLLSLNNEFEVVGEATNGREAVALARELRPDVIVMDIRMPEMNGIEATRLILAEAPDILVIGMTAFGDAGFRSAMLAAGAADLLEKQDVGVVLQRRITDCLASRGASQR